MTLQEENKKLRDAIQHALGILQCVSLSGTPTPATENPRWLLLAAAIAKLTEAVNQ